MKIIELFVAAYLALSFLSCSCPQSTKSNSSTIDSLSVEYREAYPDVIQVEYVGVKELIGSGKAVLIDVRTSEETEVSIIPGAILKKDFQLNRHLYKGKTIIPYCTIGYRSGLYAKELMAASFEALNFKGGILSWINSGGALQERSGKNTNKVHVYGRKWNLVPKTFTAQW